MLHGNGRTVTRKPLPNAASHPNSHAPSPASPHQLPLPKIQLLHPPQNPKKKRIQQTIENGNVNQAKGFSHYEPRLQKKTKFERFWQEVTQAQDRKKKIEDLISEQIDEELNEEYVRLRALPENDKQTDKQLWASVMVNHIQRVSRVMH